MYQIHDVDAAVGFKSQRVAQDYVASMHTILEAIPLDDVARLAQLVFSVTECGRNVYVFGNGGSAATADHIACDLSKNTRVPGAPPVRCLSLVSMASTMTAVANDIGYSSVFSEVLRVCGRPGDLALAVSTSGNSPNVVEGLAFARERGMHTAALLGFHGGKALSLVEVPILVQHKSIPHLEDAHNVINHMLTNCLRGMLAEHAMRKSVDLPGIYAKEGGSKVDSDGAGPDLELIEAALK
jgi:D-sedoheptulose 7-phosphate isomerase